MIINVGINPKALRETLCIAQARIGNSGLDKHRQERDIAHLQALIDECDRHRPLGPDGKHGDRHTPTCGCDVPEIIPGSRGLKPFCATCCADEGNPHLDWCHGTGIVTAPSFAEQLTQLAKDEPWRVIELGPDAIDALDKAATDSAPEGGEVR